MNESFYMHQKYSEFKAFIDGLDTDARINPNSLNLAFDVWLKLKKEIYGLARLQKMKIEQLDLQKSENGALKAMNAALTESNALLTKALNEVSE